MAEVSVNADKILSICYGSSFYVFWNSFSPYSKRFYFFVSFSIGLSWGGGRLKTFRQYVQGGYSELISIFTLYGKYRPLSYHKIPNEIVVFITPPKYKIQLVGMKYFKKLTKLAVGKSLLVFLFDIFKSQVTIKLFEIPSDHNGTMKFFLYRLEHFFLLTRFCVDNLTNVL